MDLKNNQHNCPSDIELRSFMSSSEKNSKKFSGILDHLSKCKVCSRKATLNLMLEAHTKQVMNLKAKEPLTCLAPKDIFRLTQRLTSREETKQLNIHLLQCRNCFELALQCYKPEFLLERVKQKIITTTAAVIVLASAAKKASTRTVLRGDIDIRQDGGNLEIELENGLKIRFRVLKDKLLIVTPDYLEEKLGTGLFFSLYIDRSRIMDHDKVEEEKSPLSNLAFNVDMSPELERGKINLEAGYDSEFNAITLIVKRDNE